MLNPRSRLVPQGHSIPPSIPKTARKKDTVLHCWRRNGCAEARIYRCRLWSGPPQALIAMLNRHAAPRRPVWTRQTTNPTYSYWGSLSRNVVTFLSGFGLVPALLARYYCRSQLTRVTSLLSVHCGGSIFKIRPSLFTVLLSSPDLLYPSKKKWPSSLSLKVGGFS